MGDHVWNFRCPICGDSKKSKTKARGYIYRKKGRLFFACHNGCEGMSFKNFLKRVDSRLYLEYIREKIVEQGTIDGTRTESAPELKMEAPVLHLKTWNKGLTPVSRLPKDHPSRVYIEKRLIPRRFHDDVFHCDGFFQWANLIVPGKYDKVKHDEPRIVVPFYRPIAGVVGFQGRALDETARSKYVSVKVDNILPLMYGLERVVPNRPIVALEGAFDSMFIDNSVACAGSTIATDLEVLVGLGVPKERFIIAYDNEPRKEDTVERMITDISKGFRVVVWPDWMREKDVNEYVKERLKKVVGIDVDGASKMLQGVIIKHAVHGLSGLMAISRWRRC